MGSEDSHLKDSIVAFRAVNIMDVTMTVNDEANPLSEAPVKVRERKGRKNCMLRESF